MAEQQLNGARTGYLKANAAIIGMREILPPRKCEDAHLATLEALQLMERGFLELKAYLERALAGRPDPDALDRGNRLLAEADRVKQAAYRSVLECAS